MRPKCFFPRRVIRTNIKAIHEMICESFNPLRPNNDLTQTSHCNIKGVSVSEVMRTENKIT